MKPFLASAGPAPKRKRVTRFDHIRSWAKYILLEEPEREHMYLQWCAANSADPEGDAVPEQFFNSLDQTELQDEAADDTDDTDHTDPQSLAEQTTDAGPV